MARFIFRSYQQLYRDVTAMIHKIPRNLSCVLGVARSGLIPATMIATELHVPLGIVTDNPVTSGGRRVAGRKLGKRVLVVDDSVATGTAMTTAKATLAPVIERGQLGEVLYAAVYVTRGREKLVDIYGRVLGSPRAFEWNLFNSSHVGRGMFDLDGVLCLDPAVIDNDGAGYQHAIANATLIHRPGPPIYQICTSRIERWRDITETWLKYNGIRYHELLMHPAKTAKDRRKGGGGARFKGYSYKHSPARIFVESSRKQAPVIARLSGKPVICLEDRKVYESQESG